jgi:hypothetical protein
MAGLGRGPLLFVCAVAVVIVRGLAGDKDSPLKADLLPAAISYKAVRPNTIAY